MEGQEVMVEGWVGAVPGAGVGMRTEMLCFLQLRDRS